VNTPEEWPGTGPIGCVPPGLIYGVTFCVVVIGIRECPRALRSVYLDAG
jgi:hypothetical protein